MNGLMENELFTAKQGKGRCMHRPTVMPSGGPPNDGPARHCMVASRRDVWTGPPSSTSCCQSGTAGPPVRRSPGRSVPVGDKESYWRGHTHWIDPGCRTFITMTRTSPFQTLLPNRLPKRILPLRPSLDALTRMDPSDPRRPRQREWPP